jgi:uncharacterized protein YbjT (DUF2867 family)
VIGPSGLEFCNAALLQGHRLTLYVRSPAKLPNEIRNSANVSVVKGTLEDIASFQRAATSGPTIFVSFAGPVSKSKGTVRQRSAHSVAFWIYMLTERLSR